MFIFYWIWGILMFPIQWFWRQHENYVESRSIGKIILLFAVSLSGVGLLLYALICGAYYLVTYHTELLILIGVIIWLYAYVRSRMKEKETEKKRQQDTQNMAYMQEEQFLHEQANKGYPIIRNVLYQTLKEIAGNIGGNQPRILNEIELLECHYILANKIIFYQFRLAKADLKTQYLRDELQEFEKILQTSISRKIQAGDFPTLGATTFQDEYGNIYDSVIIDIIEDGDSYLGIQAVFYSPLYAEYWRSKKMNAQNSNGSNSIPEATWGNNS